MSSYSAVAPPQNFNQSSAFAAALERAKQIAAKIPNKHPGSSPEPQQGLPPQLNNKRPLEDHFGEPESKKLAGLNSAASAAALQAAQAAARVATSNSIQGGLGSPGLNLNGPLDTEDIKVPDKMVGLIIGRGGEQITRLQAESGCKIQMAPDSNGMPHRLCTLTGNSQSIARAKELIGNIINQRSRDKGPPGMEDMSGMGNMGGGGMGNMGGGGGGMSHLEIMIPGPKVGLIIGKGGEMIKQLQEKSGAKMVIVQDAPTQEQEKPLRISGDPQKVEHAKNLVYELIAEKEAQNFNNRGGGGNRNNQRDNFGNMREFNENGNHMGGGGGGGNEQIEVCVPKAAVGVVIGKGGDMIKKLQNETGARVQFVQMRDDDPSDRRCMLSGNPDQVAEARARIEELIDSVMKRDNESGRGGRGGGNRGYDNRGGNRDFGGAGGRDNGRRDRDFGGRGNGGPDIIEETVSIPAGKCGVIIGKGGETIRQINQQTGAHCEIDRRVPQNGIEKTFIIRGTMDQIEDAKRTMSEKLGMDICSRGPSGGNDNGPPGGLSGYPPLMGSMGNNNGPGGPYNGPGGPGPGPGGPNGPGGPGPGGPGGPGGPWGPGPQQGGMFGGPPGGPGGPGGPPQNQPQQPWQQPSQPDPAPAPTVQVNPQTGQPDYSAQWADYYRALGMHREADVIEQTAQSQKDRGSAGMGGPNAQPQPQPQTTTAASQPSNNAQTQNGQPDFSAQWAEYFRNIGKHKEAEAIEAQMKAKQVQQQQPTPHIPQMSQPQQPQPGGPMPGGPQGSANPGGYNASAGYGGGYGQPSGPGSMPGGYYNGPQQGQPQPGPGGFPGYPNNAYGYGGSHEN